MIASFIPGIGSWSAAGPLTSEITGLTSEPIRKIRLGRDHGVSAVAPVQGATGIVRQPQIALAHVLWPMLSP